MGPTWAIINPRSGSRKARKVKAFVASHPELQVHHTEYSGHAVDICREAARQGVENVIAVGGDGTVRECAWGLVGSSTRLAILAAGSGNGVARSLEIPLQPEKALELILGKGKVLEIDVAWADDYPFLLSCGLGFDARVTNRFARSKNRGLWNYVRMSTAEYFKFSAQKVELSTSDQHEYQGEFYMCCVSNLKEFGNGFIISETSDPMDQKLEMTLVKRPTLLQAPGLVSKFFRGKAGGSKLITRHSAAQFEIKSEHHMFQLDGESYEGDVSLIRVGEEKLKVWVPESFGGVQQGD